MDTAGCSLPWKILHVLTAKPQNRTFLIAQNRFQGCCIQGCPAYIWSPNLSIDPFWSLYQKWNQTLLNIALQICRFATAPALFSLRTRSVYWKFLAVRMVTTYMSQCCILFAGRCCGMQTSLMTAPSSPFQSCQVSLLIEEKQSSFNGSNSLGNCWIYKNTDGACHFFFSAPHCIPHLTCGTCLVP